MLACLKAYREVGFNGVLRPDHVPTVEGDSNEHAGYSQFARLYAIGYIRGLRQRSEEHTSELQSRRDLVCRLLLEKKKTKTRTQPKQSETGKMGVPCFYSSLVMHRYGLGPVVDGWIGKRLVSPAGGRGACV